MADTNITIPELGSLTAGQVSDLLLVTRGTTGYKMLVSDIAKTIIETYQGSSLAGSTQSVKAALDSLNSRSYDYGKLGDNLGYVEAVNILKDRVPVDKPFIGCYNSSGWKIFWGYLYAPKTYGMFKIMNYNGTTVTVIIDNGTIKPV